MVSVQKTLNTNYKCGEYSRTLKTLQISIAHHSFTSLYIIENSSKVT